MTRDELDEMALVRLRNEPVVRSRFAKGVATRLLREGLVESVDMKHYCRTVRGTREHLRITDAGRARLYTLHEQRVVKNRAACGVG